MKKVGIKTAQVLLWLVYLWVSITLVLLALTFFLELFGANPTAGFVEWVYRSTQRAMAPFRGIFEPVTISDKSTLDISVLFAMIVYSFVALGLHALIDWVTRSLRREEVREYQDRTLAAQTAASAPARVVQLVGNAPTAATAVLTPATYGTSVDLSATGLEPVSPYSAWLEAADGTRVTTATFQTNPNGTVRLSLSAPLALHDARRFGVTLLPRPGDPTSIDVLASIIA